MSEQTTVHFAGHTYETTLPRLAVLTEITRAQVQGFRTDISSIHWVTLPLVDGTRAILHISSSSDISVVGWSDQVSSVIDKELAEAFAKATQ